MTAGAVEVADLRVGRPLTSGDLAHLAESWVDAGLAEQACICRVTAEEAEGLGLMFRRRGYGGLFLCRKRQHETNERTFFNENKIDQTRR